jgi:predicted GNAT family N-acyltransferase
MENNSTSTPQASLPFLPSIDVQVLRTRKERMTVAHLRTLADTTTEYQTDPELAALEEAKDEMGLVMALKLGEKPIGTIRFTPAGHNMTVTERFWGHASTGTALVGPDSWEAGRLIMSPEHRRGDLLPLCMAKVFGVLVQNARVRHLHLSTHMRLMRLYRRFGFQIHTIFTTSDGKKCALLHGEVTAVARALKVDISPGSGISGPIALGA